MNWTNFDGSNWERETQKNHEKKSTHTKHINNVERVKRRRNPLNVADNADPDADDGLSQWNIFRQ